MSKGATPCTATSWPTCSNPKRGCSPPDQPEKPKAPDQLTTVCAPPPYHIFAFTVCFLLAVRTGGLVLLVVNLRDIPGTIKGSRASRSTCSPAVNTLYNALLNDPSFKELQLSDLRVANGGGMAVQKAVADRWLAATGCPIVEGGGYGLPETSPSATCNPTDTDAHPAPSGRCRCHPPRSPSAMTTTTTSNRASPAKFCIRGPQVMAGYWQRPEDETAKVFAPDGFFKTGDIGVMDERGYVKIVDRKKDMVLVSGFNVYPNEVEDVVASAPACWSAR